MDTQRDITAVEANIRRLEDLRPRMARNLELAEHLERSIATLRRLLDTERRLLHGAWRPGT